MRAKNRMQSTCYENCCPEVRFLAATAGHREYNNNIKGKTFLKVAYFQKVFQCGSIFKQLCLVTSLSTFTLVQSTEESDLATSFGDANSAHLAHIHGKLAGLAVLSKLLFTNHCRWQNSRPKCPPGF